MIVFELECTPGGHRFEGWFGSSEDYVQQCERGLVCCPQCGSQAINKAPMAPNVAAKGNRNSVEPVRKQVAGGALPPEAAKLMAQLARLQGEALKDSRWVGESFAEESRAMHYGEREAEVIHGQAGLSEAQGLIEEGIAVMPLAIPVAPPEKLN